ncbi:substrate-binding domain-containing protein [Streptomyces sp. NPDC059740]|uniref:substrate-binding domain-containing protein n=1 Tax=Streptomyces sp. NPDC059740 TaxID=3346926 RepID=UPI0036482FFB
MREPVDGRRQRILDAVRERGAVKVAALAAELGVSVVTVRRDIEELARAGALRRGHGVARSLTHLPGAAEAAPGDAATVALLVPDQHAYLMGFVPGVRAVLEARGVRPVLHLTPQQGGDLRATVERALAEGARGLILAPRWRNVAEEEREAEWIAGLRAPTVLLERRPAPGSALHAVDSVCSDHAYGVHLAVDHLVRHGHRRIVLAARDDSPTARSVRRAFRRLAEEGGALEDWAVVLSAPDAGGEEPDQAAAGPGDLVDLVATLRSRRATALVVHNDITALAVVRRLEERGVRVPGDCSVVAYDDVVAALGTTPLTAIAPPKTAVGRAAAQLLLQRLDFVAGDPAAAPSLPPTRQELLPSLVVRGSTAALAD